jgi:hypothetical protein
VTLVDSTHLQLRLSLGLLLREGLRMRLLLCCQLLGLHDAPIPSILSMRACPQPARSKHRHAPAAARQLAPAPALVPAPELAAARLAAAPARVVGRGVSTLRVKGAGESISLRARSTCSWA